LELNDQKIVQNEDVLLIELSKGNKEAFTKLYHLSKSRVFRIAIGYFADVEDAEEVTQDIFLKIFNSAARFKNECSASTWIYRIAVNKCLDRLRFQNAKKRFAFLTSIFAEDNDYVKEIGDLTHHGIEADRQEDVKVLLKALDKIPVQQRTALVLTQIEELSGKEAAAVMDVTPKAIEGLITRGKANLKRRLDFFYDENEGRINS